jgi:ribokinase
MEKSYKMYHIPKVLVVGSLVMDLIVSTERMPNLGESVLGNNFLTAPGGKGANQAVQSARLGADVTMVGMVGNDVFGRELIKSVASAGISTEHIILDNTHSSAIGNVILEMSSGQKIQNRIIIVPGANMSIIPENIEYLRNEIINFDIVMLQLEIPMQINEIVAQYSHDLGIPVMLNPAPSAHLSDKLLSCLTYLSPNEHEVVDITGINLRKKDGQISLEEAKNASNALLAKGVENVIITLGDMGAVLVNKNQFLYSPCKKIVDVVDPTAAGDSFVGSFCTAICAGLLKEQALDFANYAAALTVSRMGAQPSIPTLEEVRTMIMHDEDKKIDIKQLYKLEKITKGLKR